MTTSDRPANPGDPANSGDEDVDTTFGNEACHLTNGDVKLALLGHYDTKHFLVTFLAAEDLLGRQSRPFGFDLAPIVRIRKAISEIVELPPTPRHGARQQVLDKFRQELIFTTAAAARESSLDLAMQLYLALMALHDREAETDAYLPDDTISAAGEYLMRCLAVQAAYSQFKTYRSLLLQFLKVVHTIKVPCRDENARIDQRFIKANTTSREELQKGLLDFKQRKLAVGAKPPDPVLLDLVRVGNDKGGPAALRPAAQLDQGPRSRLLLLAGVSNDEVDEIVRRHRADSGKVVKVVRLVDGSVPGWAPSRQGLTLILPTKGRRRSAAQILLDWGGTDETAETSAREASLHRALVTATWNALDIFEGLLDIIEKPEESENAAGPTVASNQDEAARRAERKVPYRRLEEALRLLIAPTRLAPSSPRKAPARIRRRARVRGRLRARAQIRIPKSDSGSDTK